MSTDDEIDALEAVDGAVEQATNALSARQWTSSDHTPATNELDDLLPRSAISA